MKTIRQLLDRILLHPENKDVLLKEFYDYSYSNYRYLSKVLEKKEFDFTVKILSEFVEMPDNRPTHLVDLIFDKSGPGTIFEDENGDTWVFSGIFESKPLCKKLGETNMVQLDPGIKIRRVF